ncbi:N-acetyl sugar amidotransferase [Pelagibacterales bacterium SAG-MED45]|nr:N-acetyl sugar amidotransferase [Pelagibacterales bacterium SAG-MED45]
MKYCNNCIIPDSRPNIQIMSDGKCSACHSHLNKKKISWKNRKINFKKIVEKIKKKKLFYDCLIPVSGGKDSTWQVLKVLSYGLNPLTFTYKPILRTKIGQENLDNLKKIGVHHIDFSVNENVEKKFLKKVFFKFGAVAIPMHMAMWNMSFNLAKSFSIPYIIWGENSANEYGGSKKDQKLKNLNTKWIQKYGINFNTTAKDWVDKNLTYKELAPFTKLKTEKNNKFNPVSIFLGDYFKWDPLETYKVAKKFGFKQNKGKAKTGIYKYADIDDDLISIHHFLKIYKFGFSRDFDNLSLEIRNKRLSRKQAISLIKRNIFQTPSKDIEKFCKLIGITKKEFFKKCEKFRNKKIWTLKNNKWKLKYPIN